MRGEGEEMKVRQLCHLSTAIPEALRARLRPAGGILGTDYEIASSWELGGQNRKQLFRSLSPKYPLLAEMDRDVAVAFAEAAGALMAEARLNPKDVAAIGSSGWLIGGAVELGSPGLIARLAGVPVAADFARSDIAAGGLGGPLAAWPDWVLLRNFSAFSLPGKRAASSIAVRQAKGAGRLARVVVHLGAVAGLTFLGASCGAGDVVAFDVGPGTILLDALAERLLGRPFDADGAAAAGGRANGAMLNELLANPYFQRPPPKVASAAEWGEAYVQRVMMMAEKHRCGGADLPATAAELTARSIAGAIAGLTERPHEVILAGGGARNIHLAGRIRALLSPSSTVTTEKFGVGIEALRAVDYAILAAARLDGVPCNCPAATGAMGPAILGGVYMP